MNLQKVLDDWEMTLDQMLEWCNDNIERQTHFIFDLEYLGDMDKVIQQTNILNQWINKRNSFLKMKDKD